MKRVLWLLLLAASAVGLALFMGDSRASVALFWPPYRVVLSLNLLVLGLLAFFLLLYFALRGVQLFLAMPSRAQTWRAQYHERALYQQLLQAHMQLWTGRFSRAAKSAESALDHAHKQAREQGDTADAEILMAHLLAAESAHQLRDVAARNLHSQKAAALLESADDAGDALSLRLAHWALDDGDATGAWDQLQKLPQGVQRRVHALRLKLKSAQWARRSDAALETARLLIKHNAFSPFVAQTLQAGLIRDVLMQAQDLEQLQRAWEKLPRAEQELPEVTLCAAERMLALSQHEDKQRLVRQRLLPLLGRYASLPPALQLGMVLALERALDGLDRDWLARIEGLQQQHPRQLPLQYLAGCAYLQQQLWGKAQHVLKQLVEHPQTAAQAPDLARRAWLHLARLAEQQGHAEQAQQAWKKAALLSAQTD